MHRGYAMIKRKKFDLGYTYFLEAERQHMFHPQSQEALLMSAYCLYWASIIPQEYGSFLPDTSRLLTRFIESYPNSSHIIYANYLRFMCYYRAMNGPLYDITNVQWTIRAGKKFLQDFPNSVYEHSILEKINFSHAILAHQHAFLAQWYFNQSAFIGALNRWQAILDMNFSYPLVPYALWGLIQCHRGLGTWPWEEPCILQDLIKKFPHHHLTAKAMKTSQFIFSNRMKSSRKSLEMK
jgi:outer membrane protein assembly factor BamD